MSSSELQSRERISETKRGWHEIKNEAKYLLHRKMKIIEETKLVKQVVILGKTVYRMRVTTSTFGNQLYLPQQWSNLRFIGPIYEFLRYILLRPTLVISKTKEISTYLGVAQILSHLYVLILDEKNSGKYIF